MSAHTLGISVMIAKSLLSAWLLASFLLATSCSYLPTLEIRNLTSKPANVRVVLAITSIECNKPFLHFLLNANATQQSRSSSDGFSPATSIHFDKRKCSLSGQIPAHTALSISVSDRYDPTREMEHRLSGLIEVEISGFAGHILVREQQARQQLQRRSRGAYVFEYRR
jgi:hypothetical protein